jgi:alanyl-tRNA synthetase
VTHSSYDEAIREGVMALFGEKYDDTVRRVAVPGFSEELCGGTHVSRTGEIGAFVVLAESGIAAGVRRIEAITGAGAIAAHQQERRVLHDLRGKLEGTVEELPARVQRLLDETGKLRKEIRDLRSRGSQDELAGLWDQARALPGGKLLVGEIQVETTDGIREMGDRVRQRLGRGVGLMAVRCGEKATLLAVVTDDLVAAGQLRADAIVRDAAKLAGGNGGGKPHLAMAGVQDTSKIPEILSTMNERLSASLAG